MQISSGIQFLDYDVAVVGGGPVGLAAAIALAQGGVKAVLIARNVPYADNRTTALLGDSIAFLRSISVWDDCDERSAALKVMRLVDDTQRLIRAPELRFESDEIGIVAFGQNIANRDLLAAMESRASETGLARIDSDAEEIVIADTSVEIRCGNALRISARLVIGADGRNSLCRSAAGIGMTFNTLNQSALTCNVLHSRPHNSASTEFHTSHGPCVFVPLPGNRSSVVWVMQPADAERYAAMDVGELSAVLEKQSHFHLGSLKIEPERHIFPLAFGKPDRIAAQRIALVGEAAHVLPPIGAQGLNLGLRDAAEISRIVTGAIGVGEDPGDPATIRRYETARRADVTKRGLAVGLANQSLLTSFLPAQMMRAAGMHLMNASGPLRRFVMRQAIGPASVPLHASGTDVISG